MIDPRVVEIPEVAEATHPEVVKSEGGDAGSRLLVVQGEVSNAPDDRVHGLTREMRVRLGIESPRVWSHSLPTGREFDVKPFPELPK